MTHNGQGTGSWAGKRDKHEKPAPKGPGQGPKPTKTSYKPDKFKVTKPPKPPKNNPSKNRNK